jgi:hypothetical protein
MTQTTLKQNGRYQDLYPSVKSFKGIQIDLLIAIL